MSDSTVSDSTAADSAAPSVPPASESSSSLVRASTADTHLEELAREVLELKLAALSETNTAEKSVQQLRRRLGRLRISLLLTFILFGGLVTWQLFSSRSQQIQIAQMQAQLAAIDTTQPEQVAAIANQVTTLQRQVPNNLPNVLERYQQDIQALQTTVEELDENVGDRQRTLVVLTQALQDILAEDIATPSPEPSPPAATEETVESEE
ncbi:hypothetical protein [Sphaerothrix gracilis]|uniref:hypothetical protein n=1 Tax=Sphaerothrix gracilis TaxID=3151835 RepID=UPI0031FCE4E8